MELAVRIGMQQRPHYFSSVLDAIGEELPKDVHLDIGSQFLREFTQNGYLDGWLSYFKRDIEEKEADESKRAFMTQFIDGIGSVFQCIGSDDVHDPMKDPLNKYVTQAELDKFTELKTWLKDNPGHQAYKQYQRGFRKINKRIKKKRNKVKNETEDFILSMPKQLGAEFYEFMLPIVKKEDPELYDHMFSMLKREDPRLSEIEIPPYGIEERTNFIKYVLEELEKEDIFEPNVLRRFWEHIERFEYGEVCYQMVCESFQEQYKDSEVHKTLKNIWLVSHLDTIHEQPLDARTRMPFASIDGLLAPNFGYKMERSESYQNWLTNPLAKACGDIIMDAFHLVVDFGCSLDIPLFMHRLEIDLWGSEQEQEIQLRHQYDRFLAPFQLYLLERVFNTPFVSDGTRTISNEFKNPAIIKEDLMEKARSSLENFKNMASCMHVLRPTGAPLTPKEERDGLVFGIGFNGEIFSSPSHSEENKNEIWLTFSKSRRKVNDYLFLEFLKDIAQYPKDGFYDQIINPRIEYYFELYKPLIINHLEKLNNNNDYLEKYAYERYIGGQRINFEEFMRSIKENVPFKDLNSEFQLWIRNTSNWYKIPSLNPYRISFRRNDLRVAPEMPQEEYMVQYAARNILFDALIGRSFSQEHKYLISFLFSHWKEKLLEEVPEGEKSLVQAEQKFENLSEKLRVQINRLLDHIVVRIHPELCAIWQPVINEKFQDFRIIREPKDRIEALEKDLKNIKQEIKNENKKLGQLKRGKDLISEKKEKTQMYLEDIQQKKAKVEEEMQEIQRVINQLPPAPSALNKEVYEEFRTHFFDGRDVEECVEPLFARVLGHDRFFPVYISKKVNKTNITSSDDSPLQLGNRIPNDVIAPCNKRCRHHALGHLYVGDMLCYQSADHRDTVRRTHNLDGVPDRMMTFQHFNR